MKAEASACTCAMPHRASPIGLIRNMGVTTANHCTSFWHRVQRQSTKSQSTCSRQGSPQSRSQMSPQLRSLKLCQRSPQSRSLELCQRCPTSRRAGFFSSNYVVNDCGHDDGTVDTLVAETREGIHQVAFVKDEGGPTEPQPCPFPCFAHRMGTRMFCSNRCCYTQGHDQVHRCLAHCDPDNDDDLDRDSMKRHRCW